MNSPSSGVRRVEPRTGNEGSLSLPLFILAAGFFARLIPAWRLFLNPDEALHQLLSDQPTLALAYKAALTNSHPPLLIIVLYYVRMLGHSELVLRLPSVVAGTACCWFIYKWLRLISDRSTALTALLLTSFAPAMIGLSWEIRQYALLMFFVAACLYCSERALRKSSIGSMVWFSLALYGALLVHYSALLFAVCIGVYMLFRLYPYGKRPRLFATWLVGQIVGVAISGYYVITHAASLQMKGMVHGDFETYLRKSVFHRGDNALVFIGGQTLRVFTYLFSHGVVGAIALIAFFLGLIALLRGKAPWLRNTATDEDHAGPTPRQLVLLLVLPFAVTCAAAFAGKYPYGGVRHMAFLLPLAVSGISLGLESVPGKASIKLVVVAAALTICNLFPAPPPLIRAKNQNRQLMQNAVNYLRQNALPGSLVISDYESGLLLGYYACGHRIVEEFPPFESFTRSECGPFTAMTSRPDIWKFYAADLPARLSTASQIFSLEPGTKVWFFDAGWITDSAPALAHDPRVGCLSPRAFGENIFICQLTVGNPSVRRDLPDESHSGHP